MLHAVRVHECGANGISLRGGRYEAVSLSYGSYEQDRYQSKGPFLCRATWGLPVLKGKKKKGGGGGTKQAGKQMEEIKREQTAGCLRAWT